MRLARFRSWLRAVSKRSRREAEMDAELRFHLTSFQEDLIRQGVSPDEALRRARLTFGSVEMHKEECRESLGLRPLDELYADIRYAVRMLRQSPGFAAIAIGSLALGIGANTAIFTLAKDVLLKTMAVPHSEQLRLFSWAQGPKSDIGDAWGSFDQNDAGEMVGTPFPYPLFTEMQKTELQKHDSVLRDMVAFKDVYRLGITIDGASEPLDGILVSGNFYRGLRVPVIAGRAITESDDGPNSPAVALISDAYWARRFGRSAATLGRTITVNHLPITVIGVNATGFSGPKAGGFPELFVPISLQQRILPQPRGSLLTNPSFWWVLILGRMRPGVTDEAATLGLRAEFENAFRATLPAKKPVDMPRFFLAPGNRGLDLQSGTLQKPIFLLMGVAGLVLLIACANLANLLLARGAGRQREMSVRIALGASRLRVMRQVLTESLVLAFLGGVAGLALGYWGRHLIPNLFENSWSAPSMEIQFDWRVFGFAFFITLLTGILFGLAPALHSIYTEANAGLKESGRMSTGRTRALAGKSLIVLQVALSLLLLVGAGLFVRTLVNLKTTALGMNPERLLLFELDAPRTRYSAAQRIRLYQRIEQQIASLPGVQSITLSSEPLLAGSMENACYRPTGRPAAPGREDYPFRNMVGGEFFQTIGIPIINGRGFTDRDSQGSPKVAVINQRLARQDFPNGSAIGRTISACTLGDPATSYRIVGVSADAKYDNIRNGSPPTLYLPYAQAADIYGMTYEVKTAASTASMVAAIRKAVQSVDRELPVLEVRTQMQQIDATLSQERLFALLTSGFSLLALLLASIGIYGIMAYTVSRRTNEIGIRMALGAQASGVLAMILREAALLVCIGIACGLAATLAGTRLAASMLFGVTATDPMTFAGAAGFLFVIALVAGFIPARRAAKIDPMQALRHE